MKTKKVDYREYIEAHTLRCEASYRGGGIEISLNDALFIDEDESYCMTAYQNYLGGGMLGSIQNSYNFDRDELKAGQREILDEITDALNRYYHGLTNHEDDEWESASFEQNQARPASAY